MGALLMAWTIPATVGDRDPAIATAKVKAAKFEYGRAEGLGSTDTSDRYTEGFGRFLRTFKARVRADILAGRRPPPDLNPADPRLDWATKKQLGMLDAAAPGKSPAGRPRHPAFVFRGTGGIEGQDYVSRVCQANADVVEEINTPWAATMGGLPVGAAGGIGDPSMWRAVREALPLAQKAFEQRLALNPKMKAIVGGYSAGAVVAALLRQWILENHPDNYLCSFSLGDPTRPPGGSFYRGIDPGGQGISSWHYGDTGDYRHCWVTNVADPNRPDMYSRVPLGKVGEIMQGAFDLITKTELSNPVATVQNLIAVIPEIASDAGIVVPDVLGALSAGVPGLVGYGASLLTGALAGLLVGGGNPDTLTGTAAAVKAAQIGLAFALDNPPTKPHVTYEFSEVWPGQTYLGLCIQHVRDYATRTPALAA